MTGPWKRISVFYPRGHRTGGPEALHQLVDGLRIVGEDAVLVPMPGTEENVRVQAYEHYDAPEASRARDLPDDLVIHPEVMLSAVRTRRATSMMWWLSVDFSPLYGAALAMPEPHDGRRERAVLALRRAKSTAYRRLFERRLAHISHLAQSVYAKEWVQLRMGGDPALVSDYTTIPLSERTPATSSRPMIAFNPGRGGRWVQEVRARLQGDVEWLPLVGLDRTQLRNALERADVYLDLGHLPGKDRLPREAAAAGAVTLIAQRGAGRHPEDFPLPEEHRIALEPDFPQNALATLQTVLTDLAHHHARQEPFRRHVAGERDRFMREIRTAFTDDLGGDIAPTEPEHAG